MSQVLRLVRVAPQSTLHWWSSQITHTPCQTPLMRWASRVLWLSKKSRCRFQLTRYRLRSRCGLHGVPLSGWLGCPQRTPHWVAFPMPHSLSGSLDQVGHMSAHRMVVL